MPAYAANCTFLFGELPLLERPRAARSAGFDAVEFWWPFAETVPADRDVDRFVTAVRDAGVRLAVLNFAAGDTSAGDRGLVSLPARRGEFRESVAVAVGIGEQLGVRAFNALYGNRLDGVSPTEQDELAVENLVAAATAAAAVGAAVLVEPLSAAPRYPLTTAADVSAVIERVGAANILLLADLYHLTVNGEDVSAVLAGQAGRIGHVQVADAPGRHEPGTGRIDLRAHLAALDETGYAGFVGLEYVPTTTTEESLAWLPRAQRGVSGDLSPRPRRA
jgi:hydroxypyruvate isomerase